MAKNVKKKILEKIRAYDTIVVSRHIRPDGDAVGSTMGLTGILRLSFPEKRIFLDNEDYSEYVAFLGDEGEHPTDEDYKNALVIVLDTATIDRVSNKRATLGKEIIKIDHHICERPYGDLIWIEEEASSVCEMITDFYDTFKKELKIDKKAATCLYTGMVTDSGRFRFRGTSAKTLRLAALLMEQEIDIETVHAYLKIEEMNTLLFRARLTEKVKLTENGVAWLHVSSALQKRHHIGKEDASNTVSLLEHIKGSLIWVVFIENDDGSIRVRLRSRFVEVQPIATHFRGGGHANACGATLYKKEEETALLAECDALLKEYKASHTGWL